MAKKILSTVLAIAMLMSILAVGAYAISFTDYKLGVDCIICGALESNGTESGWQAKLAGYLEQDPDIVERNLAFWDDEIIDEYHAATTTAQWRALYNKMREGVDSYDGPLDDYYPLYRYTAADKAAVDVKYEVTQVLDDTLTAREGIDTVRPGDTVIVTVSVKTSFLVYSLDLGVIYDFNKVELNTDVGVESLLDDNMWNQVGHDNPNFGWPGKDQRQFTWPASMRNNTNGEFDTYKFAKVCYCTKGIPGTIVAEEFSELTPVFKFPFKVLDGVADGTVLDFFCVDDASFSLADLELYDTYGETAFVQAYRALSPYVAKNPDGVAHFDHAWTFENTSITVGEAAPVVPAEYDALDEAIETYEADEANKADYTAASWAAYEDAYTAAKAVDRDLTADDQQIIDDAAAALTGAKTGLVKNVVKSATVAGTPVIGANATVNVVVEGEPSLLRLTDGTNTLSFASDAEGVTIVNNNDGTQTWTIKVFADGESATYDVYAKYANFTETPVTFTINATTGLDLSIHSIIVKDMYPNNMNGGSITKGKHKIIITTSTDVYKIQFVDPKGTIESGSTFTYELKNPSGNCSYVDKDGERTWTITHAFGPMGDWSMPIRTRAESTTFITTDESLTARVVY